MSNPRRICIVTGTRADYGHLLPVMRAVQQDPALILQVVATGMHLSPEFGLTHRVIEADGFQIDAKVEMLLSSDTGVGIAKSMGLATIGFADAFDRLKPDIVLLLGDRFEILAAAQAALVARIPLGHLSGGDTTEGAFDEAIRHSITKMANLHFVSNADAQARVLQMGERPETVFLTGSPAIDLILQTPLPSREELEHELGFRFARRNLLVTYHPVTLDLEETENGFQELLSALRSLPGDVGLLFTLPNADNGSRSLIRALQDFVAGHSCAKAFVSLGQRRYYGTVAQVDAVVGNSSSGLFEVPSFGKPTVNIGDRQRGRTRSASVIDCPAERGAIFRAITAAFDLDCRGMPNPYGDGQAAERIAAVLCETPDLRSLLMKRFNSYVPPSRGTDVQGSR